MNKTYQILIIGIIVFLSSCSSEEKAKVEEPIVETAETGENKPSGLQEGLNTLLTASVPFIVIIGCASVHPYLRSWI